MKMFYIPDGHRRYADQTGCTLAEAYRIGYRVLLDELIRPAFAEGVERLDVFLLSNLNLHRRDKDELELLLRVGEPLLWQLIEECRLLASVRTLGTYLERNINIPSAPDRQLNLVLGCTTADDIGCAEVDVFIRTGGEIRLSGAPRTIIGDYTQFYGIPVLHPQLRYADIAYCMQHYRMRYMRETEPVAGRG
jgi:undecaprenyl pyrophosphate synthase